MAGDEEERETQRQRYQIQRQLRAHFVNSIRKDPRLTNELPSTLVHYTSLDAFYAIAESRSLRAGRAELSNDSAEMTLAASVVAEALREREAKNILTGSLLKAVEEGVSRQTGMTLAVCFTQPRSPKPSENLLPADILSMWRAYANRGDGVAIHFAAERLRSLTAHSQGAVGGTRLLRVIYDPDDQFDLVKGVVRKAGPELLDKLPAKTTDWLTWAGSVIAAELRSFAAMFKHAGFAEENEWRLVVDLGGFFEEDHLAFVEHRGLRRSCMHLIVRQQEADEELEDDLEGFGSSDKERPLGFFAAEQLDFNGDFLVDGVWSDRKFPLPITGITLGPSTQQKQAAISVRDWALKHGLGDRRRFEVLLSQIPFRE